MHDIYYMFCLSRVSMICLVGSGTKPEGTGGECYHAVDRRMQVFD